MNMHFEHGGVPMFTSAYARVSTAEQTPENQVLEIRAAGYSPDAVYAEVVSGKIPAMERPEFAKLLDALARMTGEKRLVVSKLDRLGRDAADVLATVKLLSGMGCAVKVLALGDLDLGSPPGRLVMTTLAAVAQMERDLLVERTHAGLARAKSQGKKLGRPALLSAADKIAIAGSFANGDSISSLAKTHGVSRATIMRVIGRL